MFTNASAAILTWELSSHLENVHICLSRWCGVQQRWHSDFLEKTDLLIHLWNWHFSMCVSVQSVTLTRLHQYLSSFSSLHVSGWKLSMEQFKQILPYMELDAESRDGLFCWVYGFLNSFVSISLHYKTSRYVLIFIIDHEMLLISDWTNQSGLNGEMGWFKWGHVVLNYCNFVYIPIYLN